MPIDLTLTISDTLPTFPGSPNSKIIKWLELDEDGYNLELILSSTHAGTHIDAPYHFDRNGDSVEQIPPSKLIGRAVLIKIGNGDPGPNHAITKRDIISFEKSIHGHDKVIVEGASVIFLTGWQKKHLNCQDYFAANPGLDKSAAKYLVSRGVNLVGTDAPSIDVGADDSFVAHHILAGAGVLIVENLANLDMIDADEFDFVILPLRIEGAGGSPVRALGFPAGQSQLHL